MVLGRFCLVLAVLSLPAIAQMPVPRLNETQKAEALRLLESIRKDPRGPFGQIHWYCKDGRVLPPAGAPCGKAGGMQHAEPSAAAQALAKMNLDVVRFLAGMPTEDFIDRRRNHFWLREMAMLDYLVTREDGWIYAKTYLRRGVRQAEDEEREGRRLLTELLSDGEWVRTHYLLAMLTVGATPRARQTSRVRQIRALSASLADTNPRFQAIRGKIHSSPSPKDIDEVKTFVATMKPANPDGFSKLIALMEAEYGNDGHAVAASLEAGAQRSVAIRREMIAPGLSGRARLALAEEQLRLQDWAFSQAIRVAPTGSRLERLRDARNWVLYAVGGGYLSLRQLDALDSEIRRLEGNPSTDSASYQDLVSYLDGTVEWCRAAVAREVREVEELYDPIEPRAAELSDNILRGSVVLALSQRLDALAQDADALVGRNHRVFSSAGRNGVRALNPGVAYGRLTILDGPEDAAKIQKDRIYVIPATLADLKPMKGIITLDSGNALSHAQLLAANLGIPNATVPSALLDQLRSHENQEVFFAVTPGGTVILRAWNDLTEEQQAAWVKVSASKVRVTLDSSRVKLEDRRLRTLEEVGAEDSGVIAGPKASNLGELKRLFPAAVAPGVVVPFGVYWQHVSRPRATGQSIAEEVHEFFAEAEQLREAGEQPDLIHQMVSPRLAAIRSAIRSMPLEPTFVKEVQEQMQTQFGQPGSYGVFVRSDTNVEDLPQFTGAGLNLTVPNVVGTEKILQAIRDVWASPFEERAYAWRSEALVGSDRVYPSIVILRTVQGDKSGVLATANLATMADDELTVNVNEGVAAVVDGGVAESLLLKPDGSVRLLAQSRSPYRREAAKEGGFRMLPTSGSDYVLQPEEIQKVRQLAADVDRKLTRTDGSDGKPLPWDIEFAFEGGELRLFQIRPLVRFQETVTLAALAELEGGGDQTRQVDLNGWGTPQ